MNQDASFTAPEILATATDQFSRGFGIDPQTAMLLLLQMASGVAGPSIQVTSPDMVVCSPGFDVAGVHDGRPMFHGALVAAIDGVREEIHESMNKQTTADRRELIDKRKRLMESNGDLSSEIQAKEKRVVEIRSERGSSEWDCTGGTITVTPLFQELRGIETALPDLRQKQADVQREITDLMIVLNPGVIRMRNDWRDFPTDARHSFDGNFLQIATAESLLSETTSASNRLRSCVELLQHSRSQSTITGYVTTDDGYRACVHLHGSEEEFAALLRHPRLTSLGMLTNFVICQNTCETAPDADALGEFMESEWHSFMAQRLRFRSTGARTRLRLDRAGSARYIAFRERVWEFNSTLPLEYRLYFIRWPELLVRVAMSLALTEGIFDDGVLEIRFLNGAAALLENYAERQASALVRLMRRRNDTSRLDEQVEKLVQRLRDKGPQTRRDLARSYSGQYNVIDGRIFAALRQGRIFQRGNLYCVPDDNGNVTTMPDVSEISEGVNA